MADNSNDELPDLTLNLCYQDLCGREHRLNAFMNYVSFIIQRPNSRFCTGTAFLHPRVSDKVLYYQYANCRPILTVDTIVTENK